MNKCKKCGTEFDGLFCPECGAKANGKTVCPRCGNELDENVKFCPNCGYDRSNDKQSTATKTAAVGFDWCKLLQYLPVVFFGLWAVLLWAFYASDIIQGDGFFVESLNLYGLLSNESITKAYPLIYVFVALAALADVYMLLMIFVYVKGRSKKVANILCYVLYVVTIVFNIVFAVTFIKRLQEEADAGSSFAAVNIALTVVFALLQGVSLFLVKRYSVKTNVGAKTRVSHNVNSAVQRGFDWRRLLQYLPVVFFGLWAVLLWAFFACSVKQGDGFMTESENLYRLIAALQEMKQQTETWQFIKDMYEPLLIVCYVLIAVAAAACLQAVVYFFITKNGNAKKKSYSVVVDALLYSAMVICMAIFSVKAKNYVERTHDEPGNFVAVMISLTVVFALLQGASLFLARKFPPQNAAVGSSQTSRRTTTEHKRILFGSYPQSKVTDKNILTALNEKINGKLPASDNPNGWTDYGCYTDGKTESYMWFTDVDYLGSQYRGVYFTKYRPYYTYGGPADKSWQKNNGYDVNAVYWFKFEPIRWKTLSDDGETSLIMADSILDCMQYCRLNGGTRTIEGQTVLPNNYAESDIRKWLNDVFYNTAFDETCKQAIVQTIVDNSADTTDSRDNNNTCASTSDKVFLLSYRDVIDTNYGFVGDSRFSCEERRLKLTDYAKCRGAYSCVGGVCDGCGWWWLRSPNGIYSVLVRNVWEDGRVGGNSNISHTYNGVVPAMVVKS